MGKTGCFTQSDFPELPEETPDGMVHILRDLETGGNMGVKEEGRILDAYEKQTRTDTSPLPQEAQRRMEMFKELNMLP